MIDVNQITSTLRGMPDQQLQRYAMMHKGDPYILALAVAESNQRKQLRQAAQARNVMPQPKVADAAIAGMAQELPEDQGIAQIPAPNIQGMADGGIAGYGDGDDVPRKNGMAMGGMYDFAQRSEPVLRMSGGGHIPRYQGNTMDGSVVSSNPMFAVPGFQAVTPRDQFTQQGAPENTPLFQRILESLSGGNKERQLAMIEQKIAQGIASPEEIAAYQTAKAKAGDKTAIEAKYPAKDAVRAKDFPGVTPGYEKMSAETSAKPSADKPPVPPVVNIPSSGASVKDAQALGDKFFNVKDVKGMIEQNLAQDRQDILNEKEARKEKLAAFNKEQGPAMAGYEKLLKEEELQDTSDKQKAGLFALFKGFLGMAAGESPHAAVNIAKGAMSGLDEYSGAMKEFKKSARERNKAMASIEEARRADAKGDFKTVQDAEDKANDHLRAARQSGINAIINVTGKSAEISSGIYKTILENNANMARTMAQVNAPGQTERIIDRMARDPKFAESYKNYASIVPEARGIAGIAAKMVGNPGAMMLLKQEDPVLHAQVSAYIKQMALTPTSTPTGQVLVGQ